MHQIQRYFRKAGKAIARFFGRVAHGSILDIAILVCGVGVVGVGTTIAVVSSQRAHSLPVDASSTASSSVVSVSVAPASSESYSPGEGALDSSAYDGTLLAETADGGEAYLEETLFVGDSNTYRLATYGLTSWQNNLSASGMGIQHVVSTPSMLFEGSSNYVYMARAIQMMQPRRIVITYGTNNTDSSAETFKNQYRSALEAIEKEWPYADIIINAVPPVAAFRSSAAATQKNIDAFNRALADLAQEEGYQFLNSSEALKDPATGFARAEYMMGDGLHLNEDGAKALMQYVRTHTHVVADTRPALTSVPIHTPTPEERFNPQAASSAASSSSSEPEAKGVTVTFSIQGSTEGGTLSGTLTQTVEPGKACAPVTATANSGYSMAWGCTVGRLYPGDGLSAVNNNAQTATFVVPANTTQNINVWVTFSMSHVHTYGPWTDQNNGQHARYCSDPNCPADDKGVQVEYHSWPQNYTDKTIHCTADGCTATMDNPNYVAPHEHNYGNWTPNADGTTHTGTCSVSGCTTPTITQNHTWGATDASGNHTCTVCGATERDLSWTPPADTTPTPPADNTTPTTEPTTPVEPQAPTDNATTTEPTAVEPTTADPAAAG